MRFFHAAEDPAWSFCLVFSVARTDSTSIASLLVNTSPDNSFAAAFRRAPPPPPSHHLPLPSCSPPSFILHLLRFPPLSLPRPRCPFSLPSPTRTHVHVCTELRVLYHIMYGRVLVHVSMALCIHALFLVHIQGESPNSGTWNIFCKLSIFTLFLLA